MIHVIATIHIAPETRDDFLAEFHKLIPLVRAEEGCLEYQSTTDVPTTIPVQEPVRNDVITVVEKWADLDALQAHLQAPHMTAYRERVKAHVRGVRLQVLRPI